MKAEGLVPLPAKSHGQPSRSGEVQLAPAEPTDPTVGWLMVFKHHLTFVSWLLTSSKNNVVAKHNISLFPQLCSCSLARHTYLHQTCWEILHQDGGAL